MLCHAFICISPANTRRVRTKSWCVGLSVRVERNGHSRIVSTTNSVAYLDEKWSNKWFICLLSQIIHDIQTMAFDNKWLGDLSSVFHWKLIFKSIKSSHGFHAKNFLISHCFVNFLLDGTLGDLISFRWRNNLTTISPQTFHKHSIY